MHAGTTANEVIKEDAFGDDKAKGADLRKNKIKEMDAIIKLLMKQNASIELLMKQVAESNARGEMINEKKQKDLTYEQILLTFFKHHFYPKYLTVEHIHDVSQSL